MRPAIAIARRWAALLATVAAGFALAAGTSVGASNPGSGLTGTTATTVATSTTTTAAVTSGQLSVPTPTLPPLVLVTQTSADLSQRLTALPDLRFARGPLAPGVPVIALHGHQLMQGFDGAGGAMTDSAAWLIWDELTPARRRALLNDLFGPRGIGISFLRVPIGASDFTATGVPYSYDDQPAGASDPSLADFSIAHDTAYILPALGAAEQLDPELYLEAVPWSPPGWMKTNDALANPSHAGTLRAADYTVLAQYFVRFLQAYQAAGISFTAISPQNEPSVSTLYPGLEFSNAAEAQFIARFLRPALSAAGLDPSIFGWDLSWGQLPRSNPLLEATEPTSAARRRAATSRAVRTTMAALRPLTSLPRATLTGLAWHCYYGDPVMMGDAHFTSRSSEQIVDECSPGAIAPEPTSEVLISSLRNWARAVSLWNLALDPSGGPVQPPNSGCPGCTGIVTVDEHTHRFSFTRDYYELGQLTRFVVPGARRIASNTLVTYGTGPGYHEVVTPGVDDVAFVNPDGSTVLLAYNTSSVPQTVQVLWDRSHVVVTIPAGATTTLRWR